MNPALLVLLLVIAYLITYPFQARREGFRLVHYWLQINGYSANVDDIKVWWFLGPDGIPVRRAFVTFIATNPEGAQFDVKLRIGGFWRGSFLGVPECLSLEKVSNASDLELPPP